MTGDELVHELVKQRDALMAYILSMVGDWNAAEDLLQETSVVIITKAREGEEVRHFKAWACGVARRVVLEWWRKQKRSRLVFGEEAMRMLENAFVSGEEDDRRHGGLLEALRECLKLLAPRAKKIVEMFYMEGRRIKEIAARIGGSEGAVQVALCRARVKLGECISEKMKEEEE